MNLHMSVGNSIEEEMGSEKREKIANSSTYQPIITDTGSSASPMARAAPSRLTESEHSWLIRNFS